MLPFVSMHAVRSEYLVQEVNHSASLPAQRSDRFKTDLLAALPNLRAFLLSDFWTEGLNFRIIAPVYAAYVALLFIAPQVRRQSRAACCKASCWRLLCVLVTTQLIVQTLELVDIRFASPCDWLFADAPSSGRRTVRITSA